MSISDETLMKLPAEKRLILLKLAEALKSSWSRETAFPDDAKKWNPENSALGQCAVTALVVHDYFGGFIHRNSQFKHYWNELPSGGIVDLTREQFKTEEIINSEGTVSKKDILGGDRASYAKTKRRYRILKEEVDKTIGSIKPTVFLASSNAQPEYIKDIIETVGLPEGAIHHFRYKLHFLDKALRSLLPTKKEKEISFCHYLESFLKRFIIKRERDGGNLINQSEVIILYLNQSYQDGKYIWNGTLPIRTGIIRECYKTGEDDNSIAHFFFQIGNSLLPSSEYENELRQLFGESYGNAYAYLTLGNIDNYIERHTSSSEIFEEQCERFKRIGLKFTKDGEPVEYKTPLMVLIEGLYKQKAWLKWFFLHEKLVKPSYDLITPKSYYNLSEGKSYHLRFRTYNLGESKPFEITLELSKDLFISPPYYKLNVHSSYDGECWELTPTYVKQTTCGNMKMDIKASDIKDSNGDSTNINELDWSIITGFKIKRHWWPTIFRTVADILLIFGPIYLALTKIIEKSTDNRFVIYWPIILIATYGIWFVITLAIRLIRGE